MKKIFTFCLLIGLLIGCGPTIKYLQLNGGSKSDGTVTMSYSYGVFETPQVDWNDAQTKASNACRNWGYSSANVFGQGKSLCLARNGYGNCLKWQITYTYQCTD
tara:strand:+ start:451 stop:762 length:312 start_codon:yes stop_codon:yes gene_type:complete